MCSTTSVKGNLEIIMAELSIPYESCMEQSYDYKTSKYVDRKTELEKQGYSMIMKVVKMGARGFVAGTLSQFLGQIGIKRHNRVKCIGAS